MAAFGSIVFEVDKESDLNSNNEAMISRQAKRLYHDIRGNDESTARATGHPGSRVQN
jgi:hypothetical protein